MKKFLLVLAAVIAGSFAQNSTSSTTARPPPRPKAPVRPSPSVINGERAVLGEIPHQAYIQWPEAACGASLIQPNWILTAAHCLEGASSIEVRMGGTNRDNMPFIVSSTDIFVHEGYNPDTLFNDVGLVKLPQDAVGENIQPIPMATSGDFTGVDVRASGFGITESGQQSADLLKINLRTITNEECAQVYRSAPGLVTENTICVTWVNMEGDNVCSGDSGGPLSTVIDGQHVLIGVASFVSTNGCEVGDPAGFSRTSAFADWIQQTMANNP